MTLSHDQRNLWWAAAILLLLVCPLAARAQSSATDKLEPAIATLRHIDQSKLNDQQKKQMAKDIDAAWETIRASGPAGVARLKKEVQAVDAGTEPDNFFKLNAAALLWIIGNLDEAPSIAAIWNSTPLAAQFNYVFYTAFEAAWTHDPRALPLLEAVLSEREGQTYVVEHDLTIGWPLAQEFIWGVYGAKGLPVLADLLQTSKDAKVRQSAIHLLTDATYAKALPAIREIAAHGAGDERLEAIRSLGEFGHPQDFDFLADGFRQGDANLKTHFGFALYEFDDLRAVPILIPALKEAKGNLLHEILSGLLHLTTPASIDALQEYCGNTKENEIQEFCLNRVQGFLQESGLDWAKYGKLSGAEKEAFIRTARQQAEAGYQMKKDDQTLTHAQLLEALAEWRSLHRAFSKEKMQFERGDPAKPNQMIARTVVYYWVEERQILSVAAPDDADALVDTRGAVYHRLSDECLAEVGRLNLILRRLARSQYRQEVAITEKAIAK